MMPVHVDAPKTTGHIPVMPRPSLREQLLSAGVETLHQRGFNATSVQDITDAAGAPKGSFYNHFESLNEAALKAGFAAGCLLGNFAAELSAQSPLVREQVAEAFARWCDAIAVVIGQAQKEGAISRTLPPKALAEFVVHAWEGAMVRAKVEKDRAPLDQFLKVTFAKVLS